MLDLELNSIAEGFDIGTKKIVVNLSNNKILEKYTLMSGFNSGITLYFPGSGYIDFYEDNLVILSSRGLLAYKANLESETEKFKQIKNNINECIGLKQFKKYKDASIKDIHISKNKIFISYTEEIKIDCWNTSIIYADMNYNNIVFNKLFSSNKCIDALNIDENFKEFSPGQAGGRIITFDENHILLSVGDYRNRHLPQDRKSINGKIVKVNINTSEYEIISMGHRNPQGLYFDKENNFIFETEHGPFGGDEVNLIKVEEINQNKIPNYGWAIASYGEHYSRNSEIYKRFPLYKSHSQHGFIEPLIKFSSSIAVSEITKIDNNRYVFGSMGKNKTEEDGYLSIYFFELDSQKKAVNLEKIKVYERVRDLKYKNNKLYLFMETTSSIGIINLN